ncbi:hypothetical protein BDZ94DRAFT_1304120 [Collybia nuda]|uniref:Uncharacterized protein n=1 Tax=Collybia nuda TaxID=64659 RepID=A0A9P5YGR5_9AGAR|nr:hypothetical protein BDZ94DRAFT_1304120 [Collybia nuda]
MLSCSRRHIYGLMESYVGTPAVHRVLTVPAFYFLQLRTVRTKGGTGFYTDAVRKDERLLKKLEAQLANVQAKIKREETEAAELMKKQKHHGTQTPKAGNKTLENHNFYFWDKVLTSADRKELAYHGIRSMDDLYSVYQTAEKLMSQPPFPKRERLPPRLQFGHQMYENIPQKLAESRTTKAKSLFGGWF